MSREISEARLEEIQEQLKRKIETLSGFSDLESQARKLEMTFKYYDTDRSGAIDFTEFNAAMVRLNFVGVQRELEALFNRFDEDLSGKINYAEFALALFGMGGKRQPDAVSRSAIERVKAKIIDLGGAGGIRSMGRVLARMDKNGSKTVERDELIDGLAEFGITNLDDSEGGDLDKLMRYFDRDGSGRISIEEFLRGLKGSILPRRVALIKQIFSALDVSGTGVLSVDDFKASFDGSQHPDVLSGRITEEDAIMEMMEVYEQAGAEGQRDGVVTWREFLEYHKELSSAIENDEYFSAMMRNAWRLGGDGNGGKGGYASNPAGVVRVLVTHSDGSREEVEIDDDMGLGDDDLDAIRDRLEEQGVADIYDISLE